MVKISSLTETQKFQKQSTVLEFCLENTCHAFHFVQALSLEQSIFTPRHVRTHFSIFSLHTTGFEPQITGV